MGPNRRYTLDVARGLWQAKLQIWADKEHSRLQVVGKKGAERAWMGAALARHQKTTFPS
jgi:hypothetical protein